MQRLREGQRVEVHSVKYDGSPHRYWQSTVVRLEERSVLLETAPGELMRGPKGGWRTQGGRTLLWWDRWYNVYEAPNGMYGLIYYIHIATPPSVSGSRLVYTDLDLDVIVGLDGSVRLEDRDEFDVGILRYGYPDHVTRRALETADEVQRLLAATKRPWSLYEA